MHLRTLLPWILVLPLVPGCAFGRETTNEPIRASAVAELVPGTSTAADATRLLGAPSEVIQLGSRTAYRYDFTKTKHTGFSIVVLSFYNADPRADRVWLFFDAKDVLTHVGGTFEGDHPRYAMPWQKIEPQ